MESWMMSEGNTASDPYTRKKGVKLVYLLGLFINSTKHHLTPWPKLRLLVAVVLQGEV
jgi:hypothetical protein